MSLKAYSLTTQQRLATFIGLDYNSLATAKQNLLIDIVNQVTEFIEKYCGRRFKQTTYTNESIDGDGSSIIALKHYPVSTFTLLEFRSSSLNEDDWDTVSGDYYHVETDSGLIRGMAGYKFRRGRAAFRATYTAGFDFDNSATFLSDTQAGDVEYVAWKLGATIWNERKGSVGVQSERIGDYAVVFKDSVFKDEQIKEVLDGYKKMDAIAGIDPICIY